MFAPTRKNRSHIPRAGRRPNARLAWAVVSAALLAAPAAGDITIKSLVLEGDDVPGVGKVTRIDNLAVNNFGEWLAECDTDHSNTDADSVLIRNGELYLREDGPLDEPENARLDSFDSININNNGDSGWNFFLDGTGGTNNDSGIYFNTTLVIQESDISKAPEFTEGTPYIGFFDVKINNEGVLFCMASIDDPNIPSSVDRGLVVIVLDENGKLESESVIAKEGDILPGQVERVDDFGTGPHDTAFTDDGNLIFFADMAGSTSEDGAIYVYDGEFELLAQEGSPSPIPDRPWRSLGISVMDLNNDGDHVYRGFISGDSGSDTLIVKNGKKFIQEGDSLPAIGDFKFTSFGSSAPVYLNEAGDVLWYGDWDDPDTNIDTGLFLNDRLIIQEGVTKVDGKVIDTLAAVEDGFATSDSGRFIIFEAVLAGGVDGVFLAIIPRAGDLNCDGLIDLLDIEAFLGALVDPVKYAEEFPHCDANNADLNEDGSVDTQDIEPFIKLLLG